MKFNTAFNKIIKEYDETTELSPQLDPKTGEAEDWNSHMTRNIVKKGSDFLRSVYELGYTGEAGEEDLNEIVALLAREVEADDRLQKALDAVVTHMVNAGQADH